MTGYVKVHRALFDHPMFAGDELCPGHAWAWLIAHAAWKPTRARIGPQTVELQRGELSFSVRFLAQKWGWSKSRVARFLARLASEGMIKNRDSSGTVCGTESGTGQGIISICNYERYQDSEPESGTGSGTPRETKAGQKRDKEEEGKKEEEDITTTTTATRVRENGDGQDPHLSVLDAAGIDWRKDVTGKVFNSVERGYVDRWRTSLGLDDDHIFAVLRETAASKRDGPATSLRYFDKAMARRAGELAQLADPLNPQTVTPFPNRRTANVRDPAVRAATVEATIAAMRKTYGDDDV